MNHTEATQHIKAALAAFGPSEAINFTQDTWAKIYEAMSVLVEQAPVQEPVAYEYGDDVFWHDSPDINDYIRANGKALVYATPPAAQRQWVGLTDEEFTAIVDQACRGMYERTPRNLAVSTAHATEAKLREKNA